MTITKFSSRDFQRNVYRACKSAVAGPVFIANRGRPTHVLLSYPEYQRLTGGRLSIVDALAMPGLGEIEVEFPRSRALPRPADLEALAGSAED